MPGHFKSCYHLNADLRHVVFHLYHCIQYVGMHLHVQR